MKKYLANFLTILTYFSIYLLNPNITAGLENTKEKIVVQDKNTKETIIRKKRQFSRYICGIPPYIFHSDWPCPMWGLCANHGFTTNLPCTDNKACIEKNPSTECVQGTCCTIPVVAGGPTGNVQFLSPSVTPAIWPWPITTTVKSEGQSEKRTHRLYQILLMGFLSFIHVYFLTFLDFLVLL
ncbi:unnamed protein product [Meloidogyne enterolobii]|uniref:Uncharacterized protein n=3 Tax=Meloidogyne enterolobii TaxID=390850 RepID=A0ACB0ZI23_MELEN